MDKCVRTENDYTFEDYPPGCCPLEPNGLVEGVAVRCTTWDALYLEMLYNQRDIAPEEWRIKDVKGFEIIAAQLSDERKSELRAYDAEKWGENT